MDYETESSNIGSWQWAASTGVDAVPYFRVLIHIYNQKSLIKMLFYKTVLKDLKYISPKVIHTENGVQEDIFLNYPRQIVGINYSRNRAIMEFKRANNDK